MIGTQIKELRKKLSMTQSEFAEAINLSRNYIAMMEIDQREPSDRTIQDICEKFNVNEVWLRTGEGEPFQKETRQEQIMRFATQTVKGSDEFRKAFVSMLAKMDADDWGNLEKLFGNLANELKK